MSPNPLTEPRVPHSELRVPPAEPRVPLVEPHVPLVEPHVPLVEPVETRGTPHASRESKVSTRAATASLVSTSSTGEVRSIGEARSTGDVRTPVPFFDLSLQHAALAGALDDAVRAVLHSGRCILGPVVEAFESEFAALAGAEHVVALGSGTDALLLALRALDLPAGSEVVTTPFTFVATASSIVHAGLRPVFADIHPDTWCLDPAATESVIGPRVAAVLPVHLFGALADMSAFRRLATRRGLRLVEDAAQACGASTRGVPAGAWGDAACFSFYPTKNLGAAGDAGALATSDPELARRARLLRGHGDAGRFQHVELGGTHRMDAVQAAVLRVKAPHLGSWLAEREAIAMLYRQGLAGTDFVLPHQEPGRTWNQFCVRHPRREALREHLRARGIGSEVYYPVPLHLQACFADLGCRVGQFPVAEALAESILALPIYPGMPSSHQERVVAALREFDHPRSRRVPS